MKKFYCRENKDAALDFIQALSRRGYEQVYNPGQADFLLIDHDFFVEKHNRPIFIYPHVPYSYFLWDGIIPASNVCCNFVVGEGAREAMQSYGYPCPIEMIGFTGMKIQEFHPTKGTKLLFAPTHPLRDLHYPKPEDLQMNILAAQNIIDNRKHFESITVRFHHDLYSNELKQFKNVPGVTLEQIDVYKNQNIRQDALYSIQKSDIVISNGTFGYLAVASGKPTVFYGQRDIVPHNREGYVQNYEKYKNILEFPLLLEVMSISDILKTRTSKNNLVEDWKRLNIGDNFDPDYFVDRLESYL